MRILGILQKNANLKKILIWGQIERVLSYEATLNNKGCRPLKVVESYDDIPIPLNPLNTE